MSAPICSNYLPIGAPDPLRPPRCMGESVGKLLTPEGKPTGPVCQRCADEIVTEYREKLGWRWRLATWAELEMPEQGALPLGVGG